MSATLAPADAAVLERLAAALGPGGVVPPEPRYLEEPRGRFAGRAAAVLRPASTDGGGGGGGDLRRGAGRHRALFGRDRPRRRAGLRRGAGAGGPFLRADEPGSATST